MESDGLSLLTAWESFYVIIGSSAAVLTGLQFIVITLGADTNLPRASETTNIFANPTIVHFCAALLISAILSAPWPAASSPTLFLVACGIGGLVYVAMVFWRAHRMTAYTMVAEDWVWHLVLPFLAYAVLLIAALYLWFQPVLALYMIAACSLMFLFIGLHNAWDAATYIVYTRRQPERTEEKDSRREVG